MNITEANATATLLGWLAGVHNDRGRALAAAETLDERAAKALKVAAVDVAASWPAGLLRTAVPAAPAPDGDPGDPTAPPAAGETLEAGRG